MSITAKSESGYTVGLITVQIGKGIYWVRPAFWHDPETFYGAEANRREEDHNIAGSRYTRNPAKAQGWADAMARAIP